MMRLLLLLWCFFPWLSHASDVPKCIVTASAPTAGNSGTNSACVWPSGARIKMQCGANVYYRADGTTASATDWQLTFPGDPFEIKLNSSERKVSFLPVTGTVTCTFGVVLNG